MKKIISIIICTLLIVAVTVTALAEAEDDLLTVGAVDVAGDETLVGDINGDGFLDNKDVVLLFRYVSGNEKLDDESAYDFNGDGNVDNKDVVSLFRTVSGSTKTDEPEDTETQPEESEKQPDESEQIPDDSEKEPEESEKTPDDSEKEPEESETDPEESETDPEESESEPEESESEPEDTELELDDTYLIYEDMIYMKKPEGYSFYDNYLGTGFFSGTKDGTQDGTCFFNYQVTDALAPTKESDVTNILNATQAAFNNAFGDYTFMGFASYDVDGCTVTKLDWRWANDMDQSKVMIHFDYATIVIQFAAWAQYPEAIGEFNDMIASLGIIPEAL